MLGCSRRGFYSWQIHISGNFRHAHFGYWALLGLIWSLLGHITFGPYWALFGRIGLYLVLLGLIWSLLGLIWSVLGLIWSYWALLGPIGPYLVPSGPYLVLPVGPYLALLSLIWPWQLNKSVTQKVPTEDTEKVVKATYCLEKYLPELSPISWAFAQGLWTVWTFCG